MKEYDFVIIGGGCAGLSLAYELEIHNKLKDKTLAIIEPRDEYKRDKTWSFWRVNQHNFDDCIKRKWKEFSIKTNSDSQIIKCGQYPYESIDSGLFYNKINIWDIADLTPEDKATHYSYNDEKGYPDIHDLDLLKEFLREANKQNVKVCILSSGHENLIKTILNEHGINSSIGAEKAVEDSTTPRFNGIFGKNITGDGIKDWSVIGTVAEQLGCETNQCHLYDDPVKQYLYFHLQ